ncbi:hypothetical protein VP1G_02667 [Cytospora mali]|uniref:Uncharacterized protein n=1 Tax=Cytospora mali TaxID=578113 RepID=A0A194UUH2_CYTMA|nr:hypothetical protein VP1G_02667 [Valsa mali var. pyri (nom. inval.)]
MRRNAQWPTVVKGNLRHRFYYALVFLYAVTTACKINRQPVPYDLSWKQNNSFDTIFKDFVNRLSQFCDSKHGGDSVTAFTVLDLHNRIQFRFACNNKRNETQLRETSDFVSDILDTLRDVAVTDIDLRFRLLTKVLGFCRTRVRKYLRDLKTASNFCMKTGSVEATQMGQLQSLEVASRYADFAGIDNVAFAIRVEYLMALIDRIKRSERSVFRERAAQSSMNQSSNCWSDLRHSAGRLSSYAHGVKAMRMAAEVFPMLFNDPEVVSVKSAVPSENPIQKLVTVEKMLKTMTRDPQMARHYHSLVEDARALSLEETIQEKCNEETFRPIVHAELLVLNSLERDGLTHPSNFFNSWKYIGSSKQTCRLCDYYFRARNTGFEVRPTHGNSYLNWKTPDVYSRDGEEAIRERERIMNTMVTWIREEALRTLVEKLPRGKNHDSSTGMTSSALTMGNPTALVSSRPRADDGLETSVEDSNDDSG